MNAKQAGIKTMKSRSKMVKRVIADVRSNIVVACERGKNTVRVGVYEIVLTQSERNEIRTEIERDCCGCMSEESTGICDVIAVSW